MDIETKLRGFGGVTPPHAPLYPSSPEFKLEEGQGIATVRSLEMIARVDPGKIDKLLESTPFDRVNDRVAFRFLLSTVHMGMLPPILSPEEEMFDLMVTVPVRFQGLLAHHHVYMYCTDPSGICGGREVLGYTKKDCHHRFRETVDGEIEGWVERRKQRLAEFSFAPDSGLSNARLVEEPQQPHGELHVRRFAHPSSPEPAYADIIYRDFAPQYTKPQPGVGRLKLHFSKYDPVSELNPQILSASVSHTSTYGGIGESRQMLGRFISPEGPQ